VTGPRAPAGVPSRSRTRTFNSPTDTQLTRTGLAAAQDRTIAQARRDSQPASACARARRRARSPPSGGPEAVGQQPTERQQASTTQHRPLRRGHARSAVDLGDLRPAVAGRGIGTAPGRRFGRTGRMAQLGARAGADSRAAGPAVGPPAHEAGRALLSPPFGPLPAPVQPERRRPSWRRRARAHRRCGTQGCAGVRRAEKRIDRPDEDSRQSRSGHGCATARTGPIRPSIARRPLLPGCRGGRSVLACEALMVKSARFAPNGESRGGLGEGREVRQDRGGTSRHSATRSRARSSSRIQVPSVEAGQEQLVVERA